MSKLIEYIDREKTTISILRDYHDQLWKLDNDPNRLKGLSEALTAPKGMSSVPVQGGGSRREEKLCEIIDKKALIEQGYRQALEYKTEFMPCWERLSDEERDILCLRFIEYLDGSGVNRIIDKYNVSRTEAYRRSDKALKRLSKLLFW